MVSISVLIMEWVKNLNLSGFELWIKGCEANKTLAYCLEGCGDTALYKTQNEYWYKNNRFYTDSVYHVWKDGERIYCGMNRDEAYKYWWSDIWILRKLY